MFKSVVGLLVILLFSVLFTNSTVIKRKNPKIVIIGAGLAGISTAVKLMENGYKNILILEAEDRLGGRIHSIPFSNGIIDMGGQWIHGQKDNVVYELSKGKYDHGLTGFDDTYPIYLQSDGEDLDQKRCVELSDLALKIIFSSYDEMALHPGSIGEFFIDKFKANDSLENEILDFYHKEMNVWNGSETWFDLSARLHTTSGFNEGPLYNTWKTDGFIQFFKYLTKQLPNPNEFIDVFKKIIYRKRVANIQWNPQSDFSYAIVTTNDGVKYFADTVVSTVSLGVLKNEYRTLFSPQLPSEMILAIKKVGYGVIGKIFLEFKEPFWPNTDKKWVGYGLLWTDEDIKSLKGTGREWILNIQFFAKLDGFPNVLEALLGGPNMKIFETLSDKVIIDESMWVLEKFLKKSLDKPIAMERTRWLTNKNFYGSYSYLSIDAAKYNVDSRNLSKSLFNSKKKPEIVFAGEATDELYYSNAHAAVNSGFRAATEIIDYYL